jgi:hypothetical protein
MKLSVHGTWKAILLTFAVWSLLGRFEAAYASSIAKNVEKLLPVRTAVCWHDADMLDDLALNARGKITFLYMDGKLARELARLRDSQTKTGPNSEIPQQIFAYSRKYNSRKKYVLFVVKAEALKIWEFDAEKISVGGYSPSEKDIIKGVSANPNAELKYGSSVLPANYYGYMGFFVPSENIEPGAEIKLTYGEDSADWVVPSKDQ